MGALGHVGNIGYSWSSATHGIYSMDLYFGVTWLYPSHSDSRVFGFQLRCLSE